MQINLILVILAIVFPVCLYVYISRKERINVNNSDDFLPTQKILNKHTYGRATATAGISLATVILAFLNLSPYLGLGLLFAVLTYILGFVFLYFFVDIIHKKNPESKILQNFLGDKYASHEVKNYALFFTIVDYMSIFAMELLVGVTILKPIFGDYGLFTAMLFLVVILLYTTIAGFRGTVAVEKIHLSFVLIALFGIILVSLNSFLNLNADNTVRVITQMKDSFFAVPLSFVIGLIFLNIPATISDPATWLKLSVTKNSIEAKLGLKKAMWLFALIWGSLCVFATMYFNSEVLLGHFDSASGMSLSDHLVNTLYTGSIYANILLAIILTGLLAAMITTADSLLIVLTQMILTTSIKSKINNISNQIELKNTKQILVLIAICSYLLFALFEYFKFGVGDLVFSIYGANLSLFGPTIFALLCKNENILVKIKSYVKYAILFGFISGWTSSLYGAKLGGDPLFLYNAGAVAFAVSSVIMLFGYFKVKNKIATTEE